MAQDVEIIADDGNLCGEGPLWDPLRERLVWLDIEGSLVFQYRPSTGEKQVIGRDLMVGGVALNHGGDLVLGGATGLHLWSRQSAYRTIASEFAGEPLCFNDLIAGPRGQVYAGTIHWGPNGMEKHGCLVRCDPDGSLSIEDEGVELANGLGFSPDDRTLYFTDSTARTIHAYDVDAATGALSGRRVFVRVSSDEGVPDGLTVDREGFVWSAQWYGGSVARYDPDGRIERRIALPVRQVSSVAFGGADFTDLYVTTAANSWTSSYAPAGYDFRAPNIGGALYRIRTDIQGRSEHVARLTPPTA
jgi:sugar lactone lactonase YvrE